MKRSVYRILGVSALLLAAVVLTIPDSVSALTGSRSKLKYGTAMKLDRPFYVEGDSMRVLIAIYNHTDMDAWGWFDGAGEGCSYALKIYDSQGQLVREPGFVIGGQYMPPRCGAAMGPIDLTSGSTRSFKLDVPLIYQNRAGVGIQGDPLPPDLYTAEGFVTWNGPNRQPVQAYGPSFQCVIPFRIE